MFNLLSNLNVARIGTLGGTTPPPANLLFEWHAESTTITSGTPPGYSVGDQTLTPNAAVSLSTTHIWDGTFAEKVSGANDNYSATWANDIMLPAQGTIDFRIYFTAINGQTVFYLLVDGNNRIYVDIDSGGYMSLVHIAGGTISRSRLKVGAITTGFWYHVKARWDTTPHNGLYLHISCDQTNGEDNSADNGTDPLGTFVGSSGTLSIGDTNSSSGTYYIDDIYIYNNWVVETEVYYVDPSFGGTPDGTTTNPYPSLMGAMSAKANKIFVNPIQIRCRTSGSVADTTRMDDGSLGQMTTSASCYLEIVAESGHRAGTSWDATKYNITPAFVSGSGAGTGTALHLQHDYTRVDGLQIGISGISGSGTESIELVYPTKGNTGYIANCYIKGSNINNSTWGILRGISSISGINVFNTIIDIRSSNLGNQGIKNHSASFIYSSIVMAGAGTGMDVANDSSIVAKNCYMQGDLASFSVDPTNASLTQTTCATSDSLSDTVALRNIAVNTTTFTNVSSGTENWALPVGSPLLAPAGTDTSGDAAPFNFTTDILGNQRGSSWSVGEVQ